MQNKPVRKIFFLISFGIIILGLAMRMYDFRQRFYFGHDNDLASWIVKDILIDHHPRLIGQLTSSPGIFIGSLFYYLLIPFYILTNLDPIGSVGFSWLIGLFGLISILYVVRKLHGSKAAIISGILYAASFSLVSTEREVVPTTAVFLWSTWFYFAAMRWYQGAKKSLYLLAVLFGLVWHIHLILGILVFVIALGFLPNLRKINLKDFIGPLIVFLLVASPLLLFEVKHNFSQTRSLFFSFEGQARVERKGIEKFVHVFEYLDKNINSLIWDKPASVPAWLIPSLIVFGTFILGITKKISLKSLTIFSSWSLVLITFFSLHPINLSEYYLNSLNIVFLILLSLILARLASNLIFKLLVIGLLIFFVFTNIQRNINSHPNLSGYVQRSAVISEIKADAQKHGYPCVSISYITDPGYNLGYRYLIWRANLSTRPPGGATPVYSIVYPHTRVNHLDKTFDALGLIYPPHENYTSEGIIKSCTGPDSNTTDSMFGFTN